MENENVRFIIFFIMADKTCGVRNYYGIDITICTYAQRGRKEQ